jgi:hypothetical protein
MIAVISWLKYACDCAPDALRRVFSDGGARLSLMTFFLYNTSIPVLDLVLLHVFSSLRRSFALLNPFIYSFSLFSLP